LLITIDEDRCSACGQCVMEAPELFDQRDDDGVAVILAQPTAPEAQASALRAQAACPAGAIAVSDT
jgi:ferredoxin